MLRVFLSKRSGKTWGSSLVESYNLELLPRARRDLSSLDIEVARRILDKLEWLSEHLGELSLVQLTGQWAGLNRLHIGAYRAVYAIDN